MGRSRTTGVIALALLAAIACAPAGCDRAPQPPQRASPAAGTPQPGPRPETPLNARVTPPRQAKPPAAPAPPPQARDRSPSRIRITSPAADRTVTTNRPSVSWTGTTADQELELMVFRGATTASDPFREHRVPAGLRSWGPANDDPWPDGQYTLALVASSPTARDGSDPVTITIRNCPADLDRSGSVTIEDLYVYLNAWLAGRDPITNEPRAMAMDDVMAYINQWFAGCVPSR